MAVLDRFYTASPVWMQNAMISLKGLQLQYQRYGKEYRSYLAFLLKTETYDRNALVELQSTLLRDFLRHVARFSPYYRSLWRGLDLSKVNGPDDLHRLPILEKSQLRLHTETIATRHTRRRGLIWANTSGTTGSPLRVGFTRTDFQRRMAFLDRMLLRAGFRRGQRSARFSGRTLSPNAERNKIFWRYNKAANQMFFSTYHMREDYLEKYVSMLHRFQPVLIDGYPSALYVLARYILDRGLAGLISPTVISTTAETLHEYQREAIEAAFGCKVYNQYASSEGAPFITECRMGSMHINMESGVFEFLRPNTCEVAAPGELADLVVTSFTTTAYPLVRYRIGDAAILSDADCPCGWDTPIVEMVLGRQEDILVTKDRGYVGRLSPVFKAVPPTIEACQILQLEPDEIVLRVVPSTDGVERSHLDPVITELRKRLGEVKISIDFVENIPRGPNGKFRAVAGINSPESVAYRSNLR